MQRRQRRLHVAGDGQLLARKQQDLLHLVERQLVARGREFAVQRFEGGLLRLRFGKARFEQRELGLRFAQFVRKIGFARLRLGRRGIGVGETLRDFGAQRALRFAPFEPDGADHEHEPDRERSDETARNRLRERTLRGGVPATFAGVALSLAGTGSSMAADGFAIPPPILAAGFAGKTRRRLGVGIACRTAC